jgi:hypothetical protein
VQRYRLRRHVARVPRRHTVLREISERRPPGSEDTASDGTRERSRPRRSCRSTRMHVSMGAGLHLAVTSECYPDLSVGPSPYASRSNHAAQRPLRHCESAARAQISHPRHRYCGRSEGQLSWCACHQYTGPASTKSIRSTREPLALGHERSGTRVVGDRLLDDQSLPHCIEHNLSSIVEVWLLARGSPGPILRSAGTRR